MKFTNIIFTALAAVVLFACQPVPEILFGVEVGAEDGNLTFGPEGGVTKIAVSAQDEWVVMTEEPWIMVSPANGRGSFECEVKIDSTILNTSRQGGIRIHNQKTGENADFMVSQAGFDYQIVLDKTSVEIEDFAVYGSRSFNVEVLSNVDFDVVIPAEAENWLSFTKPELVLDRGARPRSVKVNFDWKVNPRDIERNAAINFAPVGNIQLSQYDTLKVSQKASVKIPEGTPAGDSLAVISVSRALGMFTGFDTAEKMEHWTNVEVYKDGPNKGIYKGAFKLTQEGKKAVEYVSERVNLAVYHAGKEIDDEKREIFYEVLKSISSNLKKLSEDGLPE